MELNNLNVDSITASWFLLTLFYKTERKYTCTKEKILQLLTIVALDYACKGDKVFNEDILKNDNGGAYIKELMCLSNCEYIKTTDQNDNKEYIDDILDDSKEYLAPLMYRCVTVDVELKEKTMDVFRVFASYPSNELTIMVNSILDKITTEDKKVDLTKVSYIIENEKEKNNEVLNYLKQNNLDRKNKNNKILTKR